jgi:hypothetical protein
MKKFIWMGIVMITGVGRLLAMPSQITFQGTLKQQGVPVNTTKNLQFSFVDGTGATIPGTSPFPINNVQVTNGLFAVQLPIDPSVPWEQYNPYVRVSVEGQILSPDQPLNANLYAVSAIPQGMIAMFATSCPVGWTHYSGMDGVFPMGGASYGAMGGSASHSHTLVEGPSEGAGVVTTVGVTSPGGSMGAFSGGSGSTVYPTKDTTTAVSNLPPYLTMVFCQKQ